MTNLIEDLSTLSGIKQNNLLALCKLSEGILSHSVAESIRGGESVTDVDIGIGILYIKNTDEGIKYKFVPSDKTNKTLESTFRNGKSKLAKDVSETLSERIMNTYKDLF